MSVFRLFKKRSKTKKKKDYRIVLDQPAAHRRGDLESTGAMRPVEIGQEKQKKKIFDFSYFVRAVTQVFIALFALAVMLYFGYHMVREFTSDIKTVPVRSMSSTEYIDAIGYIIRNETPLRATADGVVDYSVSDGERVAKGQAVCALYSSVSAETKLKIESLDGDISILEKSLVADTVPKGILEVSEDVKNDYSELMKAISAANCKKALDVSDAFCSDLGRFKVLSKDGSGIYDRYLKLLSERNTLISSLGTPSGNVKSDSAGYFFYECDGYESVFTPKLVKEFTEKAFDTAINSVPEVKSGVFGKIVSDSTWYVALRLEGFEMSFLEKGESCNIVFGDNADAVISMTLEKKVRTENGLMLLFSSANMPENFTYLREQNIRLERCVYSGYRVPVSAVHSYEGMTGVFTLKGGYVYFRKINVLSEGEGYYIVSAYEDIEPGMPKTYRVFSYGDKGKIDDFAAMHETCEKLGLKRKVRSTEGVRLKFGENYLYYYYLSDKENIITNGDNLYHGKVLS